MSENITIEGWEDDEYKAFVEKFKAKKTTDDCYTPPNIYEAIAGWVAREYGLDAGDFVRPFYPGGDYQRYTYPPGAVVVDNPPFSILSQIVGWYNDHKIRFFLFSPTLTLFSSSSSSSALPCGAKITYENGAEVNTSFLTNLEPPDVLVRSVPELYAIITAENDKNVKAQTKQLPKYSYPDHVLTAAAAYQYSHYGVNYVLHRSDALRIPALDAQRNVGKTIFGGGYLLSTRAAAERAAAERAAATIWTLSMRERAMIEYLDRRDKR